MGLGRIFSRQPKGSSVSSGESQKIGAIELEYEIAPKRRHGGAANPHLKSILSRGNDRYLEHLRYLKGIREDFFEIPADADASQPLLPYWQNGFLPALDIACLHGFLRRDRPRRYVEIGSGNSTKVARRAIQMHGLPTTVTSIDPQPRAEIDQICDRVIRTGVEDVGIEEFASLENGDVLFFDGSHHAYMNSDVTVFFLEILPALKPGVLVQIHDICLPYDYPATWWKRCYSEQYLLGCALLYGPERFQIEMPNMFVSTDQNFRDAFADLWNDRRLGVTENKHGASFWFRIP